MRLHVVELGKIMVHPLDRFEVAARSLQAMDLGYFPFKFLLDPINKIFVVGRQGNQRAIVHEKQWNGQGGPCEHGNGGADRKVGLDARSNMGMEVDTELELKEVDIYLARDRIDVVATKSDALKKLLKDNITTTIV